jgi:hypothetical protein
MKCPHIKHEIIEFTKKKHEIKTILYQVEYQPSVSSSNIKQARALAAGVCLQAFRISPKDKN